MNIPLTEEEEWDPNMVLPGNTKPGQHKPVLFRFYTHSIKDLCFKLKKEYATKVQQTEGE